MSEPSKRPVFLAVLAMAAACALLLALPGETVTTKYLNDLFIFLDGAHRVLAGQVPNRDFHSALGPLNYYIPAAGHWLSGGFGGAMPVGMALVLLAFAPAAAHVLDTRLRPAIAIPLGAFLVLVAAVPLNLGEGIGGLSFGMFYNRVGWAALGCLLVMYLPAERARARQTLFDALSAALLVLMMLYLKISYGAVGLGFLLFMLLDPVQRRWAAWALAIVLAAGLGIEAVWRASAAHVADLLLAGRVSGSLDTVDELARILFRNLADVVLFGMLAGLALWAGRSWRDLLFFGLCAGSGFLLISQNYQNWGIITLAGGAAVAAELLARARASTDERPRRPLAAGAPFLLLALLLPPTVHNALALGLHAALAGVRYGEPVPLAKFQGIRLARLWSDGDYPSFARYLASLEDGARALASLDQGPGRVLVLDFVGPFSAGLGLDPPKGDSTWHHWGRTVDEANFLAAETLFRDVRVVMEPKSAVEVWTADGLRQVYGEYLTENYEVALETADWKIHLPRPSPDETVSRSVEPEPDEPGSQSGG